MTIKQWLDAQVGKCLDHDGAYGYQCVDLFNFYKEFIGGQDIGGVAYAYQLWNNAGSGWEKIPNTPDAVPQLGDIIIWGTEVGEAGHVAIFNEGDINTFVSLDQNWPIGSCTHYQQHNYWGVIGWLRSKNNQNMTDKQIQEKVWAEPSTLIFAGKHDPTNRFAFLKLTGRWDYPGNKVITLDDLKFNPKTINPELLTKQLTEALKTIATRDQKVAELTGQVNTGNADIKSLQSQIEAIKGKVDDKDIEIYQLKEQLKNCQTGACPKWYESLLNIIKGWFK
ncbi:MAG: putative cell wall hydrolase LytN precursor [Firmicutes bacterium ADurb.Bin419]|nr:MAG: putative cell wall hydrolase LytN precursor [Firmicutes bacterium ADurb.Bin419]